MRTRLVLDISPIAHQCINRIVGYGGKNIPKVVKEGRKYLDKEEEQLIFLQDLNDQVNGLNNFANLVGCIGITIVFDPLKEKSFRYKILSDYKQTPTRTKEKVYNTKIFKSLLEKYYNDLIENNFSAIEHDGIEADDILYEFKRHYEEQNDDCLICIVTTDGDIKQLLNDKVFAYNPITSEITADKSFIYIKDNVVKEESEEMMLASFMDADDSGVERFFQNMKIIDAEEELLKKIITGDAMDNIESCFKYRTKNGKSEFGFTDKRFEQLKEKFPNLISLGSINHSDDKLKFNNRVNLYESMSQVVGRELDNERIDEYNKQLELNCLMIDLSMANDYHKQRPEIVGKINNIKSYNNRDFSCIKYFEHDDERY